MSDMSQELLEQVRQARADKAALQIRGRGSKDFFGRPATGRTLDVAGHKGIVDYSPKELVVTVRAGTSLKALDKALAKEGQQLAFDPPWYEGDGSIGGSLACNQSGPARPWSGSVRDALLGLRLISGRGEALRFGGQVIKNVAGYDASRLQAGALGCLGLITELSLKVMPRPEASLYLISPQESAQAALAEMARLQRRPLPITGLCYLQGKLHLRLAGSAAALEDLASELGARGYELNADEGFWQKLRDQSMAFFQGPAPLWRFSVGATTQLAFDEECLIDWGGAQRWLRGSGELEDFAAQIPAGQGQLCQFRGGPRDIEVFQQPSAVLKQLHQRLKQSFDPDGLFNPGRLYGWL